ncbi:hypothetical protein CORC01_09211 [Colletotrichum orchidophilum]|uniref:Uncharacterized protein n=1 Tax=Colletotrichum orchidophilum TaxID=1209926 RepID=A0A1G4B225_9PEZI|nr:uncharacterized protein CORC01_09211 [Colletotrichum orchidophilum]OHE95478.1 hypothetical protein CORC01_09211 [Colletotrichum orchidophilum]
MLMSMHTPHATICRQRLPLQRNPLPMHSLVFRRGHAPLFEWWLSTDTYTDTDR